MQSEKRVRTFEEMSKEANGRDYAVCDQCRIKKIRCGREKPFCSNCTRLGHKCEWSGNGKKCNQTALLSHTIESLGRRLESLEATLAETQNTVKQLVSGTITTGGVLATLQPIHTWPTPEDTTLAAYEAALYKRPLGHFLRGHNVETSERYFEPTSLESLLYDMKDVVLKPLIDSRPENQSLRECGLLAQRKFDLLVTREEETVRNGILPSAPPISILKAMIEPYFTSVNPHFPIWTKESFTQITAALQESDSSDQDLGQVVCSNNLILMTLAANLLHPPPKSSKSRQSKSPHKSSSIDLDLIKGFLANAKRAIEHVDLLLSPRLINVQALLSLCVVAQEHMPPSVFARLFNLAAQCAKSIGLHDWEMSARGETGTENCRERQYVSYCLFILDKTVCWTVGASPCIPISDVQIEAISKGLDDRSMSDLVAKAKLAEIREGIYLEIYTRRAPARTEGQVRQLICKLDRRLQDWLADSGTNLEDIDSQALPSSSSEIEHSIGFACTQLIYMWPFREHPDIVAPRIEVARRCMGLLLRLWRSASELGRTGVFPRTLASHPPLYLYEMFAHILCGEGTDSDLELLQSFTEMLQNITDLREEDSYVSRLCEVSTILMDVIAAMKIQRKRRKVQHTPPSTITSSSTSPIHAHRISPHSPHSDVHSHNYGSNISQHAQGGSQDIADLTASSFETLSSPAESRGCPEDELATIMGPLEKSPFESFDLLCFSGSQASRGESLIEKELWWD
ncbi:hypothetical protein F4677DRAFT_453142 [Hypoxylon crocopeplum]|nr:hypothetical protein F4677DRAFT_453142 [Hypoxylon crocopeplum]